MKVIFAVLASILGYLMNAFYLLLDFIGTPYIWLCIILFAIATRFLFLPGKIRSARKKKLAPVINAELADIKYRYLLSDEDNKKERKRETNALFKKYRVSKGAGCLSALLQLPIYIALYNVVISPELYVSEIKNLYADVVGNADFISQIHDFMGLDISLTPLALGLAAYGFPITVCMFSIYKLVRTITTQKDLKQKNKKIYWYSFSVLVFQVVFLTSLSFKLPLGISFYWLTNDIVNITTDALIERSVEKNKKINKILEDFNSKPKNKQPAEEPIVVEGEETLKETF